MSWLRTLLIYVVFVGGGLAIASPWIFAGISGARTLGVAVGKGEASVVDRPVTAFHSVLISGSASLHVRNGPLHVSVEAQPNIAPLVKTHVDGSGTLLIETDGEYFSRQGVVVQVTAPAIDAVTVNGKADVHLDGISADALALELDGAGSIDGSGTAKTLRFTCDGAGSADLADLHARDVTVEVNGAGHARVYASEHLTASISGVGSIRYAGNPKAVDREIAGIGSIRAL